MKALVLVAIAMIGHMLQAQSLMPFVVGSAGAVFESSSGSLSWTIGEPVSRTFAATNYLTQGFNQPTTILVTGTLPAGEDQVVVYPNPVRDILHVQVAETASYSIEMFNLQGQRLVNTEATLDDKNLVHRVDVVDVPVALYILRITNRSTGIVHYHKIEKH